MQTGLSSVKVVECYEQRGAHDSTHSDAIKHTYMKLKAFQGGVISHLKSTVLIPEADYIVLADKTQPLTNQLDIRPNKR